MKPLSKESLDQALSLLAEVFLRRGLLRWQYCVGNTALQAARHFKTRVLLPACRGVGIRLTDIPDMLERLRGAGVELVEVVGAARHEDLWVPAEDLEEFNRQIRGLIEVIAEFHAEPRA